MDEKIKVSVAVPENVAGIANQFLRLLTTPTQGPDGEFRPPPLIWVGRSGSDDRSDYVVEKLTIGRLGSDAVGDPRAMVVEVLALPIKNKFVYTGPRGADDVFVCPECKVEHSRGPLDPLSEVYRCLKCGYSGPKAEAELVPCSMCDGDGWERWPERGLARVCPSCERCPECGGSGVGNTPGALACEDICTRCAGKGRVLKDEPGPMVIKGDVEKGPVDKPKTVETPEEFAGEFGDGKTFSSDEGKQKLKRRILDRMTAVDMVDAISNGCDLPNLADIIIDLYPPEEIYEMTPKEGCCPSCNGSGRTPGTTGRQTCDPCKGTGVATGAADGAPDSPSSIVEYPREVVCEACGDVVAFARAHVEDDDTMRAIDLVKPDGSSYERFDFVCDDCRAGGPFTVRDRPRKCLHCDGAGVEIGFPDDDAPNPTPCSCCKGTGEIPKEGPIDGPTDEP